MSVLRRILVTLGAAIFLFAACGAARGQADSVTLLLQRARAFENRGRIDLAAKLWRQVIQSHPDDYEALDGLSRYATQSGNTEDARRYSALLQKAQPVPLPHAADAASQLTADQRAKLEQAGRLAADNQPVEAMKLYQEVFGESPPDNGWAIAYNETLAATPGGAPQAVAHLRALLIRHPNDPRYSLSLARILTYNPPTRAEGVKRLESIAGKPADVEAARVAWRQALVWEHGNAAYQPSLRAYLKRYPDADLAAESAGAVRAAPSPAESAMGRDEQAGYQALHAGEFDRAKALFGKMAAESANKTRAWLGLGYVAMEQQDFAAAEKYFELAKPRAGAQSASVEKSLQTARYWRIMGEATASFERSDLDAALAEFQQALTLRPAAPEALAGVTGTLMKRGDTESAIAEYRRWEQARPGDLNSWIGIFAALRVYGDPAAALVAARAMPASLHSPCLNNPDCLIPLAAAYIDTGHLPEARQLLRETLLSSGAKSAPIATRIKIAALLDQSGSYAEAADMYAALTQEDPASLDSWRGWIACVHELGHDTEALRISGTMPDEVYSRAVRDTDYLSLIAFIYEALHQLPQAHQFVEQALQNATANGGIAPLNLQLQVASLWLQENNYANAIALYRQVIERYPDNLDAWRALLGAMHQIGRDAEAIELASSARRDTLRRIESDSASLTSLAQSYSALGDHNEALSLIRRALWSYQSSRRAPPIDLEMASCWIFMDAGDDVSLWSTLRGLDARKEISPAQSATLRDIWIAWSLKRADAAMSAGATQAGLAILVSARRAFPNEVKVRAAFAGGLARAGAYPQALDEYKSWGLLGASDDQYAGAIDAAVHARDYKTASAWLAAGLHTWSNDPKLLGAGAKLALAQRDYPRANRYYQASLAAVPTDSFGATAAANGGAGATASSSALNSLQNLLAPNGNTPAVYAANPWGTPAGILSDPLNVVLASPLTARDAQIFPDGRIASNDGILSDGRTLYPDSSVPPARQKNSSAASPESRDSLDWLFARNPATAVALNNEPLPLNYRTGAARTWTPYVDPAPQVLGSNSADEWTLPPVTPTPAQPPSIPSPLPVSNLSTALISAPPPAVAVPVPGDFNPLAARDQVEDEIAESNARTSPFVATSAVIAARSGQDGFDRMVSEKSDFEASTTLGSDARLTLVAKPTFLDAGSPAANATVQLGTLAKGSLFGPMGATGLGVEGQLATQNLGIRFGVTPQGFPIQNFIGSLQYRPWGGPFEISGGRQPVEETLLSYAGVRDPATGLVWGGVVATGITGRGNWGTAESGIYSDLGYQYITGTRVANNSRISGTIGSYWRVSSRPAGNLTLGLNFSGMHYDKNLRFFTLGQGGYFSPQSYFLFNVPMHWRGIYHNRFEYSVDGSLGAQHFQEDATPYFPIAYLPSNAASASSYYPSQISTSVNYSIGMKSAYRLSGNWLIGGFFDFNNSLNYTSTNAGFYVRYQFHPTSPEAKPGELPGWNEIRTLILPTARP
jgi:cellulose synthase operon protein C